jgi:hypothetical protein
MGGIDVSAVTASLCTGLWRRTLLVAADGTRDEQPGVRWLQGPTVYVDSRGFAGTLSQDGDIFRWRRDVDLLPPGPFPDEGVMRWEDGVLVETGVHEDYVEHWVREDTASVCGAVFLRAPTGATAILVRAGAWFGWADTHSVVIDAIGGSRWQALVITGDHVRSNGVCWDIEHSEGIVDP